MRPYHSLRSIILLAIVIAMFSHTKVSYANGLPEHMRLQQCVFTTVNQQGFLRNFVRDGSNELVHASQAAPHTKFSLIRVGTLNNGSTPVNIYQFRTKNKTGDVGCLQLGAQKARIQACSADDKTMNWVLPESAERAISNALATSEHDRGWDRSSLILTNTRGTNYIRTLAAHTDSKLFNVQALTVRTTKTGARFLGTYNSDEAPQPPRLTCGSFRNNSQPFVYYTKAPGGSIEPWTTGKHQTDLQTFARGFETLGLDQTGSSPEGDFNRVWPNRPTAEGNVLALMGAAMKQTLSGDTSTEGQMSDMADGRNFSDFVMSLGSLFGHPAFDSVEAMMLKEAYSPTYVQSVAAVKPKTPARAEDNGRYQHVELRRMLGAFNATKPVFFDADTHVALLDFGFAMGTTLQVRPVDWTFREETAKQRIESFISKPLLEQVSIRYSLPVNAFRARAFLDTAGVAAYQIDSKNNFKAQFTWAIDSVKVRALLEKEGLQLKPWERKGLTAIDAIARNLNWLDFNTKLSPGETRKPNIAFELQKTYECPPGVLNFFISEWAKGPCKLDSVGVYLLTDSTRPNQTSTGLINVSSAMMHKIKRVVSRNKVHVDGTTTESGGPAAIEIVTVTGEQLANNQDMSAGAQTPVTNTPESSSVQSAGMATRSGLAALVGAGICGSSIMGNPAVTQTEITPFVPDDEQGAVPLPPPPPPPDAPETRPPYDDGTPPPTSSPAPRGPLSSCAKHFALLNKSHGIVETAWGFKKIPVDVVMRKPFSARSNPTSWEVLTKGHTVAEAMTGWYFQVGGAVGIQRLAPEAGVFRNVPDMWALSLRAVAWTGVSVSVALTADAARFIKSPAGLIGKMGDMQ